MSRKVSALLITTFAVILAGCSSSPSSKTSASSNAPPVPNISGQWEFKLLSSLGTLTGMEVALQEGQVLTNGVYLPDGNISASDTQLSFVTLNPSSGLLSAFGGHCGTGSSSANSLAGVVSALGNPVTNFTFTENGNAFTLTALLSADGQSMTGTYQSIEPTACQDSGTFTANVVSKLSGTYTGSLTLPSCPANVSGCDVASATLSNGGATLTLLLSGTDNETITLSGQVTGNAISVQDSFQGQQLVLYGYYELTHNPLDGQNDLRTLFLANAATPTEAAGLLTVPQP